MSQQGPETNLRLKKDVSWTRGRSLQVNLVKKEKFRPSGTMGHTLVRGGVWEKNLEKGWVGSRARNLPLLSETTLRAGNLRCMGRAPRASRGPKSLAEGQRPGVNSLTLTSYHTRVTDEPENCLQSHRAGQGRGRVRQTATQAECGFRR